MKNTTPAPRRPTVRTAAAEPEPTVGTGLAAAIYFAVALLYFLPAFLPATGLYGTDYLGGGWPFQLFATSAFHSGQLPAWVPHVFGGVPFYASPGNAFHPVRIVADLLPAAKVLPFVFWIHFGLAGLGMFLLAAELGCRRWVALVAGFAWQFTGITHSWVFAGHDGRVMVATVAPLFFFFLHRGIRTARVAPFAGAAATLGSALLSFQIQNAYYMLLAGAIWSVFSLLHLGVHRRPAALARVAGLGLASVVLGFALAGVNFIPFREYVEYSPRGGGGRGYEFATSYSMPPRDLVALAVPEQVGSSIYDPNTQQPLFPAYHGGRTEFKLHSEYVGALVMVLLALGVVYGRRSRYWWFFLGLGVFALSLAVGGNTPLYRLYYAALPGIRQFRAPDLAYFILAFSLVTMAAITLEAIAALRAEGRGRTENGLERLGWVAGGVAVAAVLGAVLFGSDPAGAAGSTQSLSAAQGWMRFAVFAGAIAGVLWMWTAGRMGARAAMVALSLLTVADLWVIDRKFFHTVESPEAMYAPDDVVAFLQGQPQPSRVWTFPHPQYYRGSGAYGGNYLMAHGIDQVGGEHPNPLQRFNQYVGAGQQTYIDWHNILANPQVVETAQGQAITFAAAPGLLDAANVRYIVSMAPLALPTLREVYRGSALVYENTTALPRAYLVPAVRTVGADESLGVLLAPGWDPRRVAVVESERPVSLPATPLRGDARVTEYAPNRVRVSTTANRAALLVLADNMFEGWTATIDGQPADVVRANHTFRGVVVPAGSHTVAFDFRPADLRLGFWMYALGFAGLAVYAAYLLLARRRRAPAPEEA